MTKNELTACLLASSNKSPERVRRMIDDMFGDREEYSDDEMEALLRSELREQTYSDRYDTRIGTSEEMRQYQEDIYNGR